jgi:hypothetical protein
MSVPLEGETSNSRGNEHPHSITAKLAIKPGPRPGGGAGFLSGKSDRTKDAMTDDAESDRSHGNVDRLNTVTDAVHAAAAEVSEVGRISAMRSRRRNGRNHMLRS